MKAALIAPASLLRDVQPYSDYHLILTHRVIYDIKYQNFYRERSKAGDYILLDNSAAEKRGRSVPLKEIVLAAVLTKPSVVFLPDFMFDSCRTLEELEKVLMSPQIRFLRRVLPETKLATVVQGVDPDDWLMCFSVLNSLVGLDIIGIPMLTTHIFGARWKALEVIKKKVKKQCHLLGYWRTAPLSDVENERQYSFVTGIDTSKPVRLATEGKTLDDWLSVTRNKDKTFVETNHNEVNKELLQANCIGFVSLCKGENNGDNVQTHGAAGLSRYQAED